MKIHWERLLIILGVIFYIFVFPHGIHGDATVRYEALKQLLREGTPMENMYYSYVGPLISAPLILLGKLVKGDYWWLSRFNTFIFLFTAWFLAKNFVKKELGEATARHFLLLMFCATMFPKHVTDYYSEVFSACLMALGIFAILRGKDFVGAFLALLSIWNTPGTAVAGVFVFLWFMLRERRFRYLVYIFFIAVGICAETYFKFGSLLPSKYIFVMPFKNLLPYSGLPGFSYPLVFGVLSVLFSFGKGLIFFSPAILAVFFKHVWQKKSPLTEFTLVALIYSLGLILVYSRWWAWSGDWFWGPRFYLFTSILNVFLLLILREEMAKSIRMRIFYFFALSLSLWVGCQGLIFGQDFLEDCYKNGDLLFMCHYVPEYSVLWRVFIVRPAIEGRKIAYLVYFLLVAITLLWRPGISLLRECFTNGEKKLREILDRDTWRV